MEIPDQDRYKKGPQNAGERTGGVPQSSEAAPTKPVIIAKVIRNNLEVEMQFQRSSSNTSDPLPEDVFAVLEEKGIVFGIKKDALRALCKQPTYNHPFIAAVGIPPQVGKDGWLKYLVQTTRELRPKIREDGTADFKDIGFIQNVLEGQPLCEIHLPEKGADGMDVFGSVLEGQYGREASNPAGNNTVVSEDGTMLLAAVSGNVEVRNGVVGIVDVLKIAANVDNSTGDIKFTGDVIISGDVVSGFKVQSGGSIVVKGSVEGATLEAEGDITIGESMNGMNRGVLTAGGNIKCKYIQSCYVKTQGDVYADTIMYCTLECGGNVELNGKRSTLIGGRSAIGGKLAAKTIGTSTHVATEINMCAMRMAENSEMIALAEEVKRLDGEITKMMQVLARFEDISKKTKLNEEQMQAITQIKQTYVAYAQQRKDTQAKMGKMQREQLESSQQKSFIECKDRMHTGVRISFGAVVMAVAESFVHSRVSVREGQIITSPL